MLGFLKSLLSLRDEESKNQPESEISENNPIKKYYVSSMIEENKNNIQNVFEKCKDLIIREFKIIKDIELNAMIVYIENMTKLCDIDEYIIRNLTFNEHENDRKLYDKEYFKYLLGVSDKEIYKEISKVVDSILNGKVILFIEGIDEALVINLDSKSYRSIEEPKVENVTRGPREGFIESLSTNITLLRRKIKSSDLKVESLVMGRKSRTDIVIIYISSIANQKTVNELKKRLNKIDIDSVIGANYIKEYIEDVPLWWFPTIFSTERPDVVANKLLEGRISILVDGTPLAIITPAIFMDFITTNEDYFINYMAATIKRWIRYISFIISLTLPGAFLAITTFHQEVIPTRLLVSFVNSRVDLPYPAFFECILLLCAYEIIREAASRMPRNVGQAISIVGALVLGQSAVEAGLVSTPMVIVIATTAIASFAIPSIDMFEAIVVPRFILLVLSGFSGLLGLTCGLLILFMKLSSMRSFGIPYLEPIVPVISSELPDIFMRRPLWSKFTIPWFIKGGRHTRRKKENHITSMKKQQRK